MDESDGALREQLARDVRELAHDPKRLVVALQDAILFQSALLAELHVVSPRPVCIIDALGAAIAAYGAVMRALVFTYALEDEGVTLKA